VQHSCAGSGITIAIAATITVVVNAALSAHRRDEYLQAARIGIDPDRVELELDLTPGIALAEAIIADVDRDGDGSLSPLEQRAYEAQVMRGLQVAVDDQPLEMRPIASSFPDLDAVRRGEGIIRVQSDAIVPPLSAGAHQIHLRNTHRPDVGVYLANALVPDNSRIAITAQRRDGDQRELTIHYTLRPDRQASMHTWLLGSLAGMGAVAAFLTRRSRAPSSARHSDEEKHPANE
jgi:hypothetical protein